MIFTSSIECKFGVIASRHYTAGINGRISAKTINAEYFKYFFGKLLSSSQVHILK